MPTMARSHSANRLTAMISRPEIVTPLWRGEYHRNKSGRALHECPQSHLHSVVRHRRLLRCHGPRSRKLRNHSTGEHRRGILGILHESTVSLDCASQPFPIPYRALCDRLCPLPNLELSLLARKPSFLLASTN